jgi:hypothetical protein
MWVRLYRFINQYDYPIYINNERSGENRYKKTQAQTWNLN